MANQLCSLGKALSQSAEQGQQQGNPDGDAAAKQISGYGAPAIRQALQYPVTQALLAHFAGPGTAGYLFSKYGVFTHREMHSRYEIALEQYILAIDVEAALTLEMANTIILPAALRYQTELATNLSVLRSVGAEPDTTTFDEVSSSLRSLRAGIAVLRSEIDHDDVESTEKRAEHAQKGLLPAMASVRTAADSLETMVADDLWPLATYQEMLFIL